MPRVKIDYIVSFSSEDADNPASNLLGWDVSKKRWLCAKGEPSCSVVLQLTKAVKISAVHVGTHHTALVEVLVGRSETPNEPFQVIVPSCVFLSPAESRRGEHKARVRSFAGAQLAAAAAQRWDRVRLVCAQPYNKHCKYGLSFVQIYEPEGIESPPTASVPASPPVLTAPALSAPLLADSDDDEDFRPGELFAKHRLSQDFDTGAQIRQATSHALKNIPDSSIKLVKAPISKNNRQSSADGDFGSNRQRNDVMYTADDDRPHARIDRALQRHRDEKAKDEPGTSNNDHSEKTETCRNSSDDSQRKEVKKEKHTPSRRKNEAEKALEEERRPAHGRDQAKTEPTASKTTAEKRPREKTEKDLSHILSGVELSLSGYVHPERGQLRELALRMGARVHRDWGPHCNLLVCAFDNTPKLQQVRAAPGGGGVPVVRGGWLRECWRRGRRLPCDVTGDSSTECDTDDEIEKAISKQKKPRVGTPPRGRRPAPAPAPASAAETAPAPASASLADDDLTDEEPDVKRIESIDAHKALPAMFDGCTFLLEGAGAGAGAGLLERYVVAYGGLVVQESQLDESSRVDYVVCAGAGGGKRGGACVGAEWLWRCHAAGRRLPAG